MIHHLQQHIEDVGMRFLDFVEQQYAMRLLGHRLGQQPSLIEADISGGRAYQPAHRVAFHVLAHVETNQVDSHDVGELLGRLRLPHACGTAEQKRANRFVALAQTRSGHLHRRGQNIERLILTENDILEIALQGPQLATIVIGHIGGWNPCNLCDDILYLGLGDGLLPFRRRQNSLRCACLVNDIDRLVGQVSIVDVLCAQLGRSLQRCHRILYVVVFLKPGFQTLQDLDCLLYGWLDHVDLLKAP